MLSHSYLLVLTAHISWIARDLQKAVATCHADVELSIQVYVTSRPAVATGPALSSPQTFSSLPTFPNAGATPISPTPAVFEITTEHRAPPLVYSFTSKNTSVPDVDIEKTSDSTHAGGLYWEINGVDVHVGRPDVHVLLKEIVMSSSGTVSVDSEYHLQRI